MVQRFFDLPQSEQDDVAAACAKHGFVPEDFEFAMDGARRIIAVERVVGGQFQKYKTTNGLGWTAAFEADLDADWFGAPLAD
ncbi:hypothetical protein [Cupriavidus pauculus]|uniref:Uncharacterized protein n=1 Tax=Cupriavidus pauculus TaxID=82633 RepID=A0A2N5C5A9_9BURK|nr:hypothetical protein [Cupriavidus pauculus]PLP97370.1 hypothetical protein CYJ10_27810 [Cupriavidus pauculus]